MIFKTVQLKNLRAISFVISCILFGILAGCTSYNFYPADLWGQLKPVYYPLNLPIKGKVYIDHLGGELEVPYCGHRLTVSFETSIPNVRLLALIFDFNPSQNTSYEEIMFGGSECEAYGVLEENFGGFFEYGYPGIIPLVHIYPNNLQDPERGIKSGERVIARFKLKKQQNNNSDTERPNAPDLVGTRVILQFSNDIEIGTTLEETGDFFTAGGDFYYP